MGHYWSEMRPMTEDERRLQRLELAEAAVKQARDEASEWTASEHRWARKAARAILNALDGGAK